jgi:nucleoside-diphosphate-sugar epimerase
VIVAVTGGTGFIGRHLVARHIARGDTVRYLTRNPSSKHIDGACVFAGDLALASESLRKFAQGADVLYHCAAELRNEADMHSTNVLGTSNLIAAAKGEIGRWVQLSSTGVYGRALHTDVDEENAVEPGNAYESSKAASDSLLHDASATNEFPFVVVRPSNVYAADMPNQSLFQLIKMIEKGLFFYIGRPGAKANYVHVENVIDAMMLCANAGLPGNGRAFIVSDYRTLEEFVGIVAAALGKTLPRVRLPEGLVRAVCTVAGKMPGFPLTQSRIDALTSRTVYRGDRIRSELGFENRVSMEEGISELALHFRRSKAGG